MIICSVFGLEVGKWRKSKGGKFMKNIAIVTGGTRGLGLELVKQFLTVHPGPHEQFLLQPQR